MKLCPLTVAIALALTTCARAEEDMASQARRIVEGEAYRGIELGTSIRDANSNLPRMFFNPQHSGQQQGIVTYENRADEAFDCVLLRFKDDALIELDFIYFPDRVAQLGGIQSLRQRAIDSFGPPATSTTETMLWDFPAENRMIVGFAVNGKWSLHLYDRQRRRTIVDYRDTTVSADRGQLQVAIGPAMPAPSTAGQAISTPPAPLLRQSTSQTPISATSTVAATSNLEARQQVRAYFNLDNYPCPPRMNERVFNYIRNRIKRDHPLDYHWQLHELDQQVTAFEELGGMTTPTDMATSHFTELRRDAARRWPYDYEMQLYVLKKDVDEYLMHRLSGTDGDEILAHLLRN